MVMSVSISAAVRLGPASAIGLTDRRVFNRLRASCMDRLPADVPRKPVRARPGSTRIAARAHANLFNPAPVPGGNGHQLRSERVTRGDPPQKGPGLKLP